MSAVPSGARCLWAAAADLADPVGPNGPPSNVDFYLYGGKYTYTWDNYDASYGIEYSLDNGSTVEGTFPAGTTSWASGSATLQNFAVRHYQGAFFSDWAGFF